MHIGVPLLDPFLLNCGAYFPYSSSTPRSSDSRNLTTSDELRAILRRDHCVGLRQWGEIIPRMLRRSFLVGGTPRDFDSEFRELAM